MKNLEAFEKWFESLFPDNNHENVRREAWQAACEYKQKEIDDLKQKLDAAEDCIDCFYEATKRVGW
jgi:hypothetical protein